MDDVDARIIEILKENSKLTYKKIAEKLGISDVAVYKRIKKLEESGIIKRYTILLSQEKLDKNACALLSITCDAGKARKIAMEIAKIEDVNEVYLAMGACDIVVKIRARSTNELKDIIEKRIRMINGVHEIRTNIFYECIKEDMSIGFCG